MPYTTINENRVFYRKSKKTNNTKKTIIFIHGSGGDGFVWEYQLNGLSEFITVIIPDLPGHGKSEGLCFGSAKDYAGWINDFAESLNLSSFYLAGHSLGGAVAQEIAAFHHEARETLEHIIGSLLARADAHPILAVVQEWKPECDAVDSAPLGVVAQHDFADGLAECVDVGRIRRHGLIQGIRRGPRLIDHRAPIDVGSNQLQCAGEHDLGDASLSRALEHVLVHRDVLVEDELWRAGTDAGVVTDMQEHVDALEQHEAALVIEQVGVLEPVRHVSGVDDVRGEQIEALPMEQRRHGAAEPPGCAGDEHAR